MSNITTENLEFGRLGDGIKTEKGLGCKKKEVGGNYVDARGKGTFSSIN